MKKLVSILLALAMILAMATTAFATTLTIADDATTRTYNGYKLLNLTVSLKPECGCNEGEPHKDGCYNYAYTVNEKYENILQSLATKAGETDIIKYLSGLKSDDEGATLRPVADVIYRAIQESGIEADKTGLKGNSDTIDQGYWLFADVTGLNGQNEANSLVVVDTKGKESLTITPKTGLPTLVKKVKDTNDTEGTTTDWQDSADYDIGDTVPFKLTATMPENIAGYDTYKIVFHDALSDGLTLVPSTIKVMMYANKDDTTGTDVTGSFVKPEEAPTSGKFTISCDNVKGITGVTVTKDTVFVVTYSATLDTDAVIGAAGNPNTAYLEFSNNPYGTGTGETTEDKVIVFTYQLTINKTDSEGKALSGAGFTLSKWYETTPATPDDPDTEEDEFVAATGEWRPIGEELTGVTTFTWAGLDDGYYKLEETTVPDGYNKMADHLFTITAEHVVESDAPTLTSLTTTLDDAKVEKGTITSSVVNRTGVELPETGAKGTLMLITISTMFVMVATVFMVTRKKMSIYED